MNTDTMTGANVAITGGTGSFGSTMVSHLLGRGVDTVHILSRDETKQDAMRKRFSDSRLRFFLGDVRDYDSVAGAFVSTDFVFHAAALKQVPSHNITNTGNTELTTLFWTNSLFDPEAPDTYWEPVSPTAHA